MEKEIKIFNDYVKSFDLSNDMIKNKYDHSFRVMKRAEEIAISLNLNEEDIHVATIAGLFHDIGRFNQVKYYDTFEDKKSFDHGDEGYRVLETEIKKYTDNEKEASIVLLTTKYHNKYKVEETDEKTKMFCNIVRDADKLDIMETQCNEVPENVYLKSELLEDVYNKKMCRNEYCKTETDYIIRMLDWIFDLNFDYSFQYLKKKSIIENKFKLLSTYGKSEELEKLENFIYKNIEKR